MITGLLLYVPLTIYGYVRLLQSGQSPVATAIIAFAVGDAINSGPRPFTAGGLGSEGGMICTNIDPHARWLPARRQRSMIIGS